MIRIVMDDGIILTLLIRCALFKRKLSGANIANHLKTAVEVEMGLDMAYCKAVICDRASTNKLALKELNRLFPDVHIVPFFCWSHTLSNAGKQMMGFDNAPYIESFRKIWQKIIQFKGSKARELAKEKIGASVKEAGGVRFYVHYEQITQIADYGMEKILEEILPTCIDNKWSELSSQKLLHKFGNDQGKAELAMAILEGGAIADSGKSFCQGCYTLEGDSPLIFAAAEVIKRINTDLDANVEMPRVDAVLSRVLDLLTEAHDYVANVKELHKEAVDDATRIAEENKVKVKDAKTVRDDIRGVRRGNRANARQRVANPNFVDQEALTNAIVMIAEANADLRLSQQNLEEAQKAFDKNNRVYQEWLTKFPFENERELKAHATSLRNAGTDYFRNQFLTRDGDLYAAKKVADCCATLFNPLWLEGKAGDLEFVRSKVELLQYFDFKEFSDEFMQNIRIEIEGVVDRATHSNFDWDGIDSSRLFKTRMQKRKKRAAANADIVDEDWRKDAGELATRIWEWWRPIIVDGGKFPYFSKALRLIGLIQVSSCAVERVFSALQRIRELCGDQMLEDMLEVRMHARINGNEQINCLLLRAYEHPLEDVP